jgi:ubiquitin-protein ligase
MDASGREAFICARRVRKEYEELMRNPLPNIHLSLSPDDHLSWYCLIHDLQDNYEGGEYIFQIKLSPRYPFAPPDFYMLTPSGRFEIGKKLCFSNSSMHAESWSPMWTIRTMILGFLSFFLESNSTGVGHIATTAEEKKQLASQSKQYNMDHNLPILMMIYQQNGISL